MTPKKHILFLPSWYPTAQNPLNGIFNRELAELISHSQKVSLLHLAFDPNGADTREVTRQVQANFTETIVYIKKSRNPLINQWRWYKQLLLAFYQLQAKNGQVDLMHVQVAWKMGLAAWLMQKRSGIPYIIMEHFTGYLPADGSLKGWKKRASVFLLKRAKAVTAVSDGLAAAIQNLGVKNVMTIPNSIDPEFLNAYTSNKTGWKPDENSPVFIHISNFALKQKQTNKIIQAFQKIKKEFPAATLNLVVPQKDYELFMLQNPHLNWDGIIQINPGLNRADLKSKLEQSHALISYSRFETFGLTVAEALCVGVPVIYTKCGGPEYYVQPEMGICVQPNEIESLENAMRQIASGMQFNREEIAQKAAAIFNPETIKTAWNSLYDAVLT